MNNPIYVTSPLLPSLNEFEKYLEDIWQRKWITNNGHYHKLFETSLAEYLKVPYVSLFTNGTLPLITALQALKITGEVITTPYSFVATTHSLWWNGIKPVFVDIEPTTGNIDPQKIEAVITSKTTAIMPVHVYGNPCKTNEIQKIADKYGVGIAQIPVAWAIAKGTLPIIGVTKVSHVEDAVKAANITLTADEVKELESVADSLGLNVIRGWEKEMK